MSRCIQSKKKGEGRDKRANRKKKLGREGNGEIDMG